MPRDEFGVPAHIPPEISTTIRHTYYIPPQYYPFLKKLGDDTPELKPWMDKLMNGEMTFDDYEESSVGGSQCVNMSPQAFHSSSALCHELWLAFSRTLLRGDVLPVRQALEDPSAPHSNALPFGRGDEEERGPSEQSVQTSDDGPSAVTWGAVEGVSFEPELLRIG